jgi:CelD/BcsL family acetyltransferase involved in cellulose biosynthesis
MFDLADPETLTLAGVSDVRRIALKAISPRVALWRIDRAVAIVSDRAAFDALQTEWGELEKSATGATFFQSSAWCRAVYDHHEAHGQDFDPLVLTLRVGGRLVGLLPLQRVKFGVSCIVTGFAEPYQQYTDVLVAADAPADTAARLLNAACRLPNCDGVNLLKVRDDSSLAPLLSARNAIKSNEDAAPYVDLTPHSDFQSYLSTLNTKTRKNMRNIKNRIARIGTLDHRVWADRAEVRALVERAHQGRERWLEEQGLTSRAFRDKSFGDFGRSLANPENGLEVMAMSLTINDQPVADQWGFVFNGRYYAYVATWRPEFEEASPGKLHLEEVIRACHQRGLAVADFLMPAVRYKFTWTPTAVGVADYALPLSLGARLQFSLWSAHLRPMLKRVALKVPAGLRSRVANILLRR